MRSTVRSPSHFVCSLLSSCYIAIDMTRWLMRTTALLSFFYLYNYRRVVIELPVTVVNNDDDDDDAENLKKTKTEFFRGFSRSVGRSVGRKQTDLLQRPTFLSPASLGFLPTNIIAKSEHEQHEHIILFNRISRVPKEKSAGCARPVESSTTLDTTQRASSDLKK